MIIRNEIESDIKVIAEVTSPAKAGIGVGGARKHAPHVLRPAGVPVRVFLRAGEVAVDGFRCPGGWASEHIHPPLAGEPACSVACRTPGGPAPAAG